MYVLHQKTRRRPENLYGEILFELFSLCFFPRQLLIVHKWKDPYDYYLQCVT